MYVFRSRVYSEDEIVFKYYQFIDAQSEQEFDSYMNDMDGMSLYDTGVTAQYGDRLFNSVDFDYNEISGCQKMKEYWQLHSHCLNNMHIIITDVF